MLKNLQTNINKRKVTDIDRQHVLANRTTIPNMDIEIACNTVEHLFAYIHSCIECDKSNVKLNMFTKAFIKSLLNNSVKDGMKDFIRGMPDPEAKALLDSIQKEMNKRAK